MYGACIGLSLKMSFLLCVIVKIFEYHYFILKFSDFYSDIWSSRIKTPLASLQCSQLWSCDQDLTNKMWQKWCEESLMGTLTLQFSRVFHPVAWCATFIWPGKWEWQIETAERQDRREGPESQADLLEQSYLTTLDLPPSYYYVRAK